MRKRMTAGLLLATAGAALALASSAAAEQPSSPGMWVKSQDYESHYLCQSAGLTGEFFGL